MRRKKTTDQYVTECIVCVSDYDPLTFSFLSFLFVDWVGVLWPQLFKVLKLVRWASSVLFSPSEHMNTANTANKQSASAGTDVCYHVHNVP